MEIVILKPNDNKSSNPSELYQLLIKSQSPDFDKDKVSTKFPQFSNKPIYPVYAFMGGLLSQEVVKLITHQFVPIDNTFIYDGINGENSQTIRI